MTTLPKEVMTPGTCETIRPGRPIGNGGDIAKISEILSRIKDPGRLPHLQSSIVLATNIAPKPPFGLASQLKRRAWLSIVASISGISLITTGGMAVFPGLLILGVGLLLSILVPDELKRLRDAKANSDRACRSYQEAWTKKDEYHKYSDTRQGIDSLIATLFNAAEPINPSDFVSLKTRTANSRAEVETNLRFAIAKLQQLSISITESRRKVLAGASNAYRTFRQAELDARSVDDKVQPISKFLTLGCTIVAAFVLVDQPRQPAINADLPDNLATTTQPSPTISTEPAPHLADNTKLTPKSESTPQRAPSVGEPAADHLRDKSPVPALPTKAVDETKPSLDLATAADATRVQRRLHELGYLVGTADGKWGPRSRAALRGFRVDRNLGRDGKWDITTERVLFGHSMLFPSHLNQ